MSKHNSNKYQLVSSIHQKPTAKHDLQFSGVKKSSRHLSKFTVQTSFRPCLEAWYWRKYGWKFVIIAKKNNLAKLRKIEGGVSLSLQVEQSHTLEKDKSLRLFMVYDRCLYCSTVVVSLHMFYLQPNWSICIVAIPSQKIFVFS